MSLTTVDKPHVIGSEAHYGSIVLGAGISGLVSASILLDQGCRRVLLVDEYPHIGGNHIDRSVGDYTFDVGSFIFQDDSPLLRHFPELLPRYLPVDPSWCRLNPKGVVTRYPISPRDDLLAEGPIGLLRVAASVIGARLFQREIANARDFARFWIGSYLLHRSGLEHYMRRFCGTDAELIDVEFAQKRMMWISENARIKALLGLFQLRKPAPPTNRQLVRPREGFAHLYEVVRKKLESRGVLFLLGADLENIEKAGTSFSVRTDRGTFTSDRLISTIPIQQVAALSGLDAPRLRSIPLLSLFYSFDGQRGFAPSILYNFSHGGTWKRMTVHSDFYGRVKAREYFTVEITTDDACPTVATADKAFRAHVRENGLLDGDLRLEGSNLLDNAYPLYKLGSTLLADEAIAKLAMLGIESFGRQGGFNYQPTARVSTIEAEAHLARVAAR